jgi:hypothetical protein
MRSVTKIRTGLTASEIKQAFRDNLVCGLGRPEGFATKHDLYVALALTVRDRLLERTVNRMEDYGRANARRVFVGRIFAWAASGEQSPQSRHYQADARSIGRARLRPR